MIKKWGEKEWMGKKEKKRRKRRFWFCKSCFTDCFKKYSWLHIKFSFQRYSPLTELYLVLNFFFVSALLWDCSLCWDCWNRTWHRNKQTNLMRPCYVALGRVLIWFVQHIGWGVLDLIGSSEIRTRDLSVSSLTRCHLSYRASVSYDLIFVLMTLIWQWMIQ